MVVGAQVLGEHEPTGLLKGPSIGAAFGRMRRHHLGREAFSRGKQGWTAPHAPGAL